MSLADEIAEQGRSRLKPITDHSASILTLDIETSPHLAYSFELFKTTIRAEQIVEPSRILMVGMKWYGQKTCPVLSERKHGHDLMIRKIWDAVDRADIVMHYNGKRFDLPHLKREWLMAGLPPPRPFKQIDLYQVVKGFAFASRKLDSVAKAARIGEKMKHEGFGLWLGCLNGDVSAWKRMERYCRQDVLLTEDVADWLRPWISNHPHVTVSDVPRCNRCGSTNLERITDYTAVVNAYGGYRCQDCGGTLRNSNSKRIANTRGTA